MSRYTWPSLFFIAIFLILTTGGKRSKVLNMFQVTRFPNDQCTVAGTAVRLA